MRALEIKAPPDVGHARRASRNFSTRIIFPGQRTSGACRRDSRDSRTPDYGVQLQRYAFRDVILEVAPSGIRERARMTEINSRNTERIQIIVIILSGIGGKR